MALKQKWKTAVQNQLSFSLKRCVANTLRRISCHFSSALSIRQRHLCCWAEMRSTSQRESVPCSRTRAPSCYETSYAHAHQAQWKWDRHFEVWKWRKLENLPKWSTTKVCSRTMRFIDSTYPCGHWWISFFSTLSIRGMLGPHRSTSRIPTYRGERRPASFMDDKRGQKQNCHRSMFPSIVRILLTFFGCTPSDLPSPKVTRWRC